MGLRLSIAEISVTLRSERSEPRRATAPAPRPHPSRAASRPPQGDGKGTRDCDGVSRRLLNNPAAIRSPFRRAAALSSCFEPFARETLLTTGLLASHQVSKMRPVITLPA